MAFGPKFGLDTVGTGTYRNNEDDIESLKLK